MGDESVVEHAGEADHGEAAVLDLSSLPEAREAEEGKQGQEAGARQQATNNTHKSRYLSQTSNNRSCF